MLDPRSLPGYEFVGTVYQGPESIIYRARRLSDQSPVIIKTGAGRTISNEGRARLRREFSIARSLPFEIAPYLDLLETGRGPALIMEDRNARALNEWTYSSLKQFLDMAFRMALALDTVHEAGIVHRDVKPGNLLTENESLKPAIIDFGIASRISSEASDTVDPGGLEGTLLYMSPEQTGRTNRRVDERSDLYSLGATLYEVITGSPPYPIQDPLSLIHAHLTRNPEPIRRDRNGDFIPAVINDIVLKLMARDQEERYQTALGLAQDLRKCLELLEGRNQIPLFSPGEKDFPRGLVLPQKLYGRQKDLSTIEKCIGEDTGLIFVTGKSGSGKSSLVRELKKGISLQEGYFLAGKFEPDKKDIPYYAISQCISSLTQNLLSLNSHSLKQWKDSILERLKGNGQALVDIVPSLEKLLGPQPELVELAPEEERIRFRLTLLAFLSAFRRVPMVFFLDDMQWADLSSLDLIQELLTAEDNLTILGAYREEEVNELHPLSRAAESYRLAGIKSLQLSLQPLGPRDMRLMLLDTFRISAEDEQASYVEDLAEALYRKSEGNPFVARQYMESLYSNKWIRQDRQTGAWIFDLARIRTDGLTRSAADILASRIEDIPEAKDALEAAATLGSRFRLSLVAGLLQQDVLYTLEQLSSLAQAGLIFPLGEKYKYVTNESTHEEIEAVEYAFSHDRIHEAALSRIPGGRLEELNLQAARLILEHSSFDEIDEQIGTIVSYYNHGRNLVWDDEEKLRIADLNHKAGLKEKKASAYDEAAIHFGISLDTLHQRKEPVPRELKMEILRNLGEIEYLRGRKLIAREHFDEVLKNSRQLEDKLKIYEFQIALLSSSGQYREAVGLGLQALKQAGRKIRNFTASSRKTLLANWGKKTVRFLDLYRKRIKKKKKADQETRSTARILAQCITPAFLIDSPKLPSLLQTLLELSEKEGPFPETAVALVVLGALLCHDNQDFQGGKRAGDLALDLVERYNARDLKGRVNYFYLACIQPWNEPLENRLPLFRRVTDYCLEAGDLPFAGLSIFEMLSQQMLRCKSVPDLERLLEQYEPEIARTGQEDIQQLHSMLRQALYNLKGGGRFKSRLRGDYFDEDEMIPRWKKDDSGRSLFFLQLYQHWLAVLFFPENSTTTSIPDAKPPLAHPDRPLLDYLQSVHSFASSGGSGATAACFQELATLEKQAPENFGALKSHLQAEMHWKNGEVASAMTAFDRACEQSGNYGPMLSGMIHERAAHFYLSLEKPDFSSLYAEKALRIYEALESHAQSSQVERLLDTIRTQQGTSSVDRKGVTGYESSATMVASGRSLQTDTGRDHTSELELESVMRMANIVSSEIELDQLLRRLLQTIMESAGARKAVILERNGQGFIIRAQQNPGQAPEISPLREPDPSADLPMSVINYADRTGEPVVLDRAFESESHSSDPYIVRTSAASILCIPLLLKGQVTNIVYLEHDTSTSAFSSQRVRVLTLLGSQIATSLENARLYEEVKQALQQEQNARLSEAEINRVIRRFVPEEFLSILGVTNFAKIKLGENIEQEMTVLFSDIRSFTTLSESMTPEENFRFINSYLSRIGPLVRENGGFIDKYIGDAIMALFDKPQQAVSAARAMMLELDSYNRQRKKAGYDPIKIGVGVHTGVLRLGIIGEEGRIEGTVIGDTVNLAARLESLTASYGTSVIVSDSTRHSMKDSTLFTFRPVDRVRVKGKKQDNWIYELVLDSPGDSYLKRYNQGIQAYQDASFSAAREHFLKLKQERPDDRVIDLYLKRLERLMAGPTPEDWQGIENLKRK